MPKLRRRLALPIAIVLGALLPSSAHAQSAADKAAAQALFDDAQKLAGSGDWTSACPKYAESNRLDPGIGVKLYLADCYEHVGKTASAWAMFGEAEEYARKAGDARAAVAHQRAERLTPRIVQLVIAVPSPAAGLAVRRDNEDVGSAQWGVPVPVDPGPHAISASAPGKAPWSASVDAKDGAGTVRVEVPTLADAPSAAATPAPAPPAATSGPTTPPATDAGGADTGHTQRVVALVAAGAGVAGVAIGSAFGLVAKSKLDQSNDGHCHDGNLCDATGVQLRSDAKSDALASTIAFVVGGAGLAAGAVLWFTAPKAATTVGVSPVVTDRFAGLRLGGAF
jgi:hypothetical protein